MDWSFWFWLFLGFSFGQLFKSIKFENNMCPMCFKTFNRKDHVQRHYQELHLQQIHYQCRKCTKKFKRRYLMDNHEKNCNGQQLHQCFSCKNVYKSREYLLNHVRKVHLPVQNLWFWYLVSRIKNNHFIFLQNSLILFLCFGSFLFQLSFFKVASRHLIFHFLVFYWNFKFISLPATAL